MLNWRPSAFIVTAVMVLLLLAAILPRVQAADGLSDEFVFFEMKAKSNPKAQVRLGIPKKYLHTFDASSWTTTYRFTTIEAVLPDMRPSPVPHGKYTAVPDLTPEKLALLRNQVSIEWMGGQFARDYTPQKHYENLLKRSRLLGSTDSGLMHLREQRCWPVGPTGPAAGTFPGPDGQQCAFKGNDVFTFKPVTGQDWVYFDCTQFPAPREGICRGRTQVRKWGIEYNFDRSELRRWREFDSGVRRLVESFFEAGQRAKKD